MEWFSEVFSEYGQVMNSKSDLLKKTYLVLTQRSLDWEVIVMFLFAEIKF